MRVQGESKAAGKSTVDEPESDDDMPELEEDDGTMPSSKVDEPESEEEEVVTRTPETAKPQYTLESRSLNTPNP